MNLNLSKDWYDKGADLEGDHAVGAGYEILEGGEPLFKTEEEYRQFEADFNRRVNERLAERGLGPNVPNR